MILEGKVTKLKDGDMASFRRNDGTVGFMRGGMRLLTEWTDDKFLIHGEPLSENLCSDIANIVAVTNGLVCENITTLHNEKNSIMMFRFVKSPKRSH